MYTFIILDDHGKSVKPSLDVAATPASYFAGIIALFADFLNGGQEFKKAGQKEKIPVGDLGTQMIQTQGWIVLLSQLHEHPFFSVSRDSINTERYREIAQNLSKNINDRSTIPALCKIFQKFIVPGISVIQIKTDSSLNQIRLQEIDFPDELIPEKYLCAISSELITNSCYDPENPHVIYEKSQLLKILEDRNGKNPFTNRPLPKEKIAIHEELNKEIELFFLKATLIFNEHPEDYQEFYKKFQDHLFNTQISLDDFKKFLPFPVSKTLDFLSTLWKPSSLMKRSLLFEKYNLEAAKENEGALLWEIVLHGNSADLKFLLGRFNFDANSKEKGGRKRSVLHLCIAKANQVQKNLSDYLECISLLLANGADVNIPDKNGKLPLEDNHSRVIKILCDSFSLQKLVR